MTKRMHYSRYKKYYSQYRAFDYDKATKEITVVIPDKEYKEYSNEGNRYQMDRFYIEVIDNNYTGNIAENKCWQQYITAKSKDNALRNAKRLCKANNFTLVKFSCFSDFRDC